MKTLLIAASAMAVATSAHGQTAPATAAPTATSAPVVADPAASPAAPAAAAAQATPAAQSPDQVIATEFPTYDKDSNGSLSRAEFDTWLTALKEKGGGKPLSAPELKKWLAGSFASADKDKSKSVSQAELTAYLAAGA